MTQLTHNQERLLFTAANWLIADKNGGWVGYYPNRGEWANKQDEEDVLILRGKGLLTVRAEWNGPYLHRYYRLNVHELLKQFITLSYQFEKREEVSP